MNLSILMKFQLVIGLQSELKQLTISTHDSKTAKMPAIIDAIQL